MIVDVQKDAKYTREGNDILTSEEITVTQAILGTNLKVETVQGTKTIQIDAGLKHGNKYNIKGAGMKY